jgi:hypothetical protein
MVLQEARAAFCVAGLWTRGGIAPAGAERVAVCSGMCGRRICWPTLCNGTRGTGVDDGRDGLR